MQELMSRHKAYALSPRDCLKTTLFQKWQKMVAPPGKHIYVDLLKPFFKYELYHVLKHVGDIIALGLCSPNVHRRCNYLLLLSN